MASCPRSECGLGMDDRAADKRGGPTLTAAGGIDRKQGKTRSDDVPRGIVCIYPVGEVLCLRSFASLIADDELRKIWAANYGIFGAYVRFLLLPHGAMRLLA